MNSDRYRPVIAVDVDGVLRGLTETFDPAVSFAVSITMHRDAYPTYLHGQPDWDENGESTEVEFFSLAGAAWIRDLVARGVDVQWATTWQEHANDYFTTPLGIPPQPVAVTGPGRRGWDSGTWKAASLARQFDGRPLLWIDDNPGRGASILEQLRQPGDRAITHTHRVMDFLHGMTEADVTAANEWISLASTAEGQEELRRRAQMLEVRGA